MNRHLRPTSGLRSTLASMFSLIAMGAVLAFAASGCKRKQSSTSTAIQNIGSDTMVNLAQAWAEEYANVSTRVYRSRSRAAARAWAWPPSSTAPPRSPTPAASSSPRRSRTPASRAQDPKEFLVGFDGLAIYVHKDNPLETISMEELAEIYKEGGKLTKWSELGVNSLPGSKGDDIIRVSRQNNSGTYHYFRETVVGKKNDFKPGSMDMNGSKDVVELVGKTPGCHRIQRAGLRHSRRQGREGCAKKGRPGHHPLGRHRARQDLPHRPTDVHVHPGRTARRRPEKYLDWILSDVGPEDRRADRLRSPAQEVNRG